MSGWLTSCGESNLIEIQGDSWVERISYGSISGGVNSFGTMRRTHTPKTIEYVGLDINTAKAFASDNPASEKYDEANKVTIITKSCRWVRDGDGGSYKVVKETETVTDWETEI